MYMARHFRAVRVEHHLGYLYNRMGIAHHGMVPNHGIACPSTDHGKRNPQQCNKFQFHVFHHGII